MVWTGGVGGKAITWMAWFFGGFNGHRMLSSRYSFQWMSHLFMAYTSKFSYTISVVDDDTVGFLGSLTTICQNNDTLCGG